MSYIDWGWYNSHFPKVSEEDFKLLNVRAEMRVDTLTHNRSRTAEGYKLERLQACVANVINAFAEQEEIKAGSGVKSVSNDGYSESYECVTKEQADEQIRAVCRELLSGTGLMGAL